MRAVERSVWTRALVAMAAIGLAAPAVAGEVYSWRTEEGAFAYAGDVKNIPPRYRSEAVVVHTGKLDGYARYTPNDDAATDRYAERLAQRVLYLRQLNAERPAGATSAGEGDAPELVIRTGRRDRGGVDLAVPASRGEGPVVVETVQVRRHGSTVTEHAQVIRRGDEIISVVRPRSREWNVSDVQDADELYGE